MGQKVGRGLAGWFWGGVSCEVAVKMSVEDYRRLKAWQAVGLASQWLTCIPNKLVLDVSWKLPSIAVWTSSLGCLRVLMTWQPGFLRRENLRECKTETTVSSKRVLKIPHCHFLNTLQVTAQPYSVWERTIQGCEYRRQGSLEPPQRLAVVIT